MTGSRGEEPRLELRILGPTEMLAEGVPVPLTAAKLRTVLVALLLSPDHFVSDAWLSELLWGPRPPATAAAQLYTYISRLRGCGAPGLRVRRRLRGYHLDIGTADFDWQLFRRAAERGRESLRKGQYGTAATQLTSALGLWRGPALSDVTEALHAAELPRLEESRLAVLEDRVEADLALGRHARILPELVGLVAEHPLRESLRGQLMTALYLCGRPADALNVYEQGRRILKTELGIDPGPTLRRIHRAVLLESLPGPGRGQPRDEAGPTGSPWDGLVPAMLPMDVADLAGRTDELARTLTTLRGRPEPARGVVLTGPAGTGKSALAVRAAHACRSDFPHGQLYIDLRAHDGAPKEPMEVLGGFLRALFPGCRTLPETLDERVQLYRSLLARRRVLVVLDNAADDRQVRPLLPGGDHSRAVVTSRHPMASLEGLRAVRLGRLDRTAGEALLAGAVGHSRVRAEPEAVARVVELCDGLPLALRVCAERLMTHPHWRVADLVDRLLGEDGRLDLLCEGSLDVRARLRASVLELRPPLHGAFRALSPMSAGAFTTTQAAERLSLPRVRAQTLLDALVGRRLLEVSAAGPAGAFYCFPPLVGLLAREQPDTGQPVS
ncbi:AfsR family transcriptional regulator [Streptomyces sp. BG9H]|uniref:AfsR family transcriptional regulator n=1 Tax=Streptomyces anatolicus TaxID=2675858 RepID=A0ABS6YGX8_9ACTN|nr:AfsR/SARP family transcriptional regulator [Streptomyces anatolicus]MBW5420662.1 AfsR family transcriptional regulator [Streptomyces anatolicus]